MEKISTLLAGLVMASAMAQSPGSLSTGRLLFPRIKMLIILLFMTISIQSFATTYYVKNGGNDGNTGLSDVQAWATIAKVNAHALVAGDQVLFKRGSTWVNETIEVHYNGSPGNPIIYGAYGTGEKPIITGRASISGWNTEGNWTNTSGNIWRKPLSNITNRLWLSGSESMRCSSAAVTESLPWFSTESYLYVYSTSNPTNAFSNIEGINTISETILGSADYITIQNIDSRGTNWRGISISGVSNWIIEDCNIGRDCSGTGVHTGGTGSIDNIIIRRCDFDTYDHNVDAYSFNNTFEGIQLWTGGNTWDIYENTFTDWTHAAFSIEVHDPAYPAINIKFHDNICTAKDIDYGRGFNFIFYPLLGNSYGNEVYNNFFYSHGVHNLISGDGLKFYNNIIDGIRTTSHTGGASNSAGIDFQPYAGISENNIIYNNVIMNCAGAGIACYYATQNFQGNLFKNNIFYNNGLELNSYQIDYADNGHYFENNTFQNNLFFRTGITDIIFIQKYTDAPLTVAEFNAKNGSTVNIRPGCGPDIVGNNIGGDPLFVDATNANYLLRDYHLKAGSPAIGKGINVGLSKDHDGNEWNATPSIGAFEYNSGPIVPVYVSSVIENATPALLVMTYNVSLANIVPAASAFTVLVNSVAWAVNSLSISGTKVQLTLASPVAYGDIITVSYTKPASNPLQTGSGGQAAGLSAQPVTNHLRIGGAGDILDLADFAWAYGSSAAAGVSNWLPNCDLNDDGIVDDTDIDRFLAAAGF